MTGNDDHRLVSDTHSIAIVPRTPETDQLTDDQIITSLHEWKARRQQPDRERWPMPQPFNEWMMATKPGPQEPCPDCGSWSLRRGASPDGHGGEKVICTMLRCEASPFYRA